MPRVNDCFDFEEFEVVVVRNVVVIQDVCNHRLGLVNGVCVQCNMRPLHHCFYSFFSSNLNKEVNVVLKQLEKLRESQSLKSLKS